MCVVQPCVRGFGDGGQLLLAPASDTGNDTERKHLCSNDLQNPNLPDTVNSFAKQKTHARRPSREDKNTSTSSEMKWHGRNGFSRFWRFSSDESSDVGGEVRCVWMWGEVFFPSSRPSKSYPSPSYPTPQTSCGRESKKTYVNVCPAFFFCLVQPHPLVAKEMPRGKTVKALIALAFFVPEQWVFWDVFRWVFFLLLFWTIVEEGKQQQKIGEYGLSGAGSICNIRSLITRNGSYAT